MPLDEQALPQPPQWPGFELQSTQPPQFCSPDWQVKAQTPELQIKPAEQAEPELFPTPTLVQSPAAPQWVRLAPGSVQIPPQSIKPS
jgi:hypothetical protein